MSGSRGVFRGGGIGPSSLLQKESFFAIEKNWKTWFDSPLSTSGQKKTWPPLFEILNTPMSFSYTTEQNTGVFSEKSELKGTHSWPLLYRICTISNTILCTTFCIPAIPREIILILYTVLCHRRLAYKSRSGSMGPERLIVIEQVCNANVSILLPIPTTVK